MNRRRTFLLWAAWAGGSFLTCLALLWLITANRGRDAARAIAGGADRAVFDRFFAPAGVRGADPRDGIATLDYERYRRYLADIDRASADLDADIGNLRKWTACAYPFPGKERRMPDEQYSFWLSRVAREKRSELTDRAASLSIRGSVSPDKEPENQSLGFTWFPLPADQACPFIEFQLGAVINLLNLALDLTNPDRRMPKERLTRILLLAPEVMEPEQRTYAREGRIRFQAIMGYGYFLRLLEAFRTGGYLLAADGTPRRIKCFFEVRRMEVKIAEGEGLDPLAELDVFFELVHVDQARSAAAVAPPVPGGADRAPGLFIHADPVRRP